MALAVMRVLLAKYRQGHGKYPRSDLLHEGAQSQACRRVRYAYAIVIMLGIVVAEVLCCSAMC